MRLVFLKVPGREEPRRLSARGVRNGTLQQEQHGGGYGHELSSQIVYHAVVALVMGGQFGVRFWLERVFNGV